MPSRIQTANQPNDSRTAYLIFLLVGVCILFPALFSKGVASRELLPLFSGNSSDLGREGGIVPGSRFLDSLQANRENTGSLASATVNKTSISEAEWASFLLQPIPVNKASAALLATIPGVGPSLAGQIANYIRTNGALKELADLQKIRGVGVKKAKQIGRYIRI